VRSDFFLTKYLHLIIPLLLLLTGLFYLLILAGGGFRKTRLKKPVLIAILIVDVVLAGAFAMTVNARAFGWGPFKYEQTEQQTYALPTLEPTRQPAETPTSVPETPVPETPEPTEPTTPAPGETPAPETPTPEPTEEPTPEPFEEQEGSLDDEAGEHCALSGDIEVLRPGEEPLWTPVFENITFLINGELMDSSQQLVPDGHILTAHCTVVATEACDTTWTCGVRFRDADFLTRTALVTLGEGENDVLIVIRADEPLETGEYIVKLYEGEALLGGNYIDY
jgi:hypothetical protein